MAFVVVDSNRTIEILFYGISFRIWNVINKEDINKEDINKEDINKEDINKEDINKEDMIGEIDQETKSSNIFIKTTMKFCN